MEVEVNALMGAADEAIWRREGLFTSTDALEFNVSNNSHRGSVKIHRNLLLFWQNLGRLPFSYLPTLREVRECCC
jgi:hypothetical protein